MQHWKLDLMQPVVICMWKMQGILTPLAYQFRPDSSRDELCFLAWEVSGCFLKVQN